MAVVETHPPPLRFHTTNANGKYPLGELKEYELTITTMQKNSPLSWITNWLNYHHYQGLNSGWKIQERTHILEYDPVKHERADFMIKTLERVNLRERKES